MSVAIVDYGSGNLHSAQKAFERAAREASTEAHGGADPCMSEAGGAGGAAAGGHAPGGQAPGEQAPGEQAPGEQEGESP